MRHAILYTYEGSNPVHRMVLKALGEAMSHVSHGSTERLWHHDLEAELPRIVDAMTGGNPAPSWYSEPTAFEVTQAEADQMAFYADYLGCWAKPKGGVVTGAWEVLRPPGTRWGPALSQAAPDPEGAALLGQDILDALHAERERRSKLLESAARGVQRALDGSKDGVAVSVMRNFEQIKVQIATLEEAIAIVRGCMTKHDIA